MTTAAKVSLGGRLKVWKGRKADDSLALMLPAGDWHHVDNDKGTDAVMCHEFAINWLFNNQYDADAAAHEEMPHKMSPALAAEHRVMDPDHTGFTEGAKAKRAAVPLLESVGPHFTGTTMLRGTRDNGERFEVLVKVEDGWPAPPK